ncbi:hypothetical protein DIGNKC_36 [Bacillus phage DIGNKC]|uniref:hypothetical protein n=1 Tax=Bacillus phage DIGNKC TaxID=1805948 RepID=UPI0007A771C6|nr:hypothetical protein BI007_gp036 [Bacillus phage DIGNKC]AMW62720.1 hypothetical protein DIGNKC_36 [Bacillus phage DIGNKC]
MLKVIEKDNDNVTLSIKDAGDKLKFKVKDTGDCGGTFSIKLGYNKLKKLSKKLHVVANADESDIPDGTSIVIEKSDKFLEVEIAFVNLGFVVGTLDGSVQTGWEVIVIQYEDLTDILKVIDNKLISLEEDLLSV